MQDLFPLLVLQAGVPSFYKTHSFFGAETIFWAEQSLKGEWCFSIPTKKD